MKVFYIWIYADLCPVCYPPSASFDLLLTIAKDVSSDAICWIHGVRDSFLGAVNAVWDCPLRLLLGDRGDCSFLPFSYDTEGLHVYLMEQAGEQQFLEWVGRQQWRRGPIVHWTFICKLQKHDFNSKEKNYWKVQISDNHILCWVYLSILEDSQTPQLRRTVKK